MMMTRVKNRRHQKQKNYRGKIWKCGKKGIKKANNKYALQFAFCKS